MSPRAIYGLLLAVTVLLIGMVPPAQAAGPEWTATMTHNIDPFERGSEPYNRWDMEISNTGDAPAEGPITITDVLPPGVKVKSINWGNFGGCPTEAEINSGAPMTCTLEFKTPPVYEGGAEPVQPGQALAAIGFTLEVVSGSPDTLINEFTISGGGAPATTVTDSVGAIDLPPWHLKTFDARVYDSAQDPYTVAGGHPWEALNRFTFPLYPSQEVKDLYARLPLGMFGNPAATPRCPIEKIYAAGYGYLGPPKCPVGSKIGRVGIAIFNQYTEQPIVPLYNVIPDKGYAAQFTFNYFNTVISIYVIPLPRSKQYGLVLGSPNAARVGVRSFSATFFGVPSDHGEGSSGAPFVSNSVNCSEAEPSWEAYADSWENPGRADPVTGFPDVTDPIWTLTNKPAPPVTGCDDPALTSQWGPSIDVQPVLDGPAQPDKPAGLEVEFEFPQTNDPTDLSTVFDPSLPQAPEPKHITVKLPAGLSVNPGQADGLKACSDLVSDPAGDQVHYDTTKPVSCPTASIIGSATTETPLLASRDPVDDAVTGPDPIPGDVYLLKPHPGDLSPGEDGIFRTLIVLESPRFGINFKLPGTIRADKSTGQMTATFLDNPQLPSSRLKVNFKSGPRATLATPPTCGAFTTTTNIVPWSSPETPDATPSSSFAINMGADGSPCADTPAARSFQPSLTAGTRSTAAGQPSPFVLRVARNDGEQEFDFVDVVTPKGFTASLKGVSYCSEGALAAAANRSGSAEAASPSCPASSQVGTLTTAAGPGPRPFQSSGSVHLAGPYKGAPLSLALITPVVAGPFDLGTIVVRAALDVDPVTTQVTIHSDLIPQIFDGVPLRIQSIVTRIDRPGFSINPTNCEPKAINATIRGANGAVASPSNAFQVDGCKKLGFAPKLSLKLKGSTKRTGNPALTAVVNFPQGAFANIASASVALPKSEFLDNTHIKTVCTRVQFAANACPADSIYGFAKATTPLLDAPIEGPVYLRSSDNKLPDLVADMGGQLSVELAGKVDTAKNNGLRNTFEVVPDAPVTKFTLELQGGKKGLLENSENLCKHTQRATANFTGQNGKVYKTKPLVANSCKGKKSRRRSTTRSTTR